MRVRGDLPKKSTQRPSEKSKNGEAKITNHRTAEGRAVLASLCGLRGSPDRERATFLTACTQVAQAVPGRQLPSASPAGPKWPRPTTTGAAGPSLEPGAGPQDEAGRIRRARGTSRPAPATFGADALQRPMLAQESLVDHPGSARRPGDLGRDIISTRARGWCCLVQWV